jgi:hypothetical protein
MPLYILTCLPEDREYVKAKELAKGLICKAAEFKAEAAAVTGAESAQHMLRTAQQLLDECYEVIEVQQKVT